ncbi:hypothetical protein ALCH109712_02850 [Alkalicoccus chagannorensis]
MAMLSFVVDFIRFRRTLAQGLVLNYPSRSEGGFSDGAYPLSVTAYRYFHQVRATSFNRASFIRMHQMSYQHNGRLRSRSLSGVAATYL